MATKHHNPFTLTHEDGLLTAHLSDGIRIRSSVKALEVLDLIIKSFGVEVDISEQAAPLLRGFSDKALTAIPADIDPHDYKIGPKKSEHVDPL